MAAHAIRAGEGDVFVAAGVETVSRYMHGASDTGPHNPAFAEAEQRTKVRTPAVTEPWAPPAGLPDVYIAMGQTAENVAEYEKVEPRGDGRVRPAVADPGRRSRRRTASSSARSSRSRSPTARW